MSIELRKSTQFSSPEAYSVHTDDHHIGYIALQHFGRFTGYDRNYEPVRNVIAEDKETAARMLKEKVS